MKFPLFRCIASTLQAYDNCQTRNPVNTEWAVKHTATIDHLTKDFMPSGSGIDSGCAFDWSSSTPEKLVFLTSYHHMNESGMYDGWTEHKVIVTPSLCSDFDLKITGQDRNEIKDYLSEVFSSALEDEIDHDETGYFSPALRAAQAAFKAKVASGEIV
jgi:hypothetical protein